MKILFILSILYLSLFSSIGSVSMLKGKATITRDGDVFNTEVGAIIEEGDKINTFAKSKIQIILNDNTITTLGKNTEYIFNSYSNGNNPHAEMTLIKGFLRTVTGKIGKIAPEKFKVKTATATIGIRGTGWITYVGDNIEQSLCFAGAITITTKDNSYYIASGNMLLMKDGVFKKYRADMDYFNAEIKDAQTRAKTKSSNTQQSVNLDGIMPYNQNENVQTEAKTKSSNTQQSVNLDGIMPYEPNTYTQTTGKTKNSNNQQVFNLDEDMMPFIPNSSVSKLDNLLEKNEGMLISVVGQGVAPSFGSSPAQKYAMAKRAAIADAYRLIAERIHGVHIEGQDSIKNMMIKRSTIRSKIKGMIKNANIVETTYKDGLCEVEMEIRIHYNQFN